METLKMVFCAMNEIYGLKLRSELVVLSAYETALGEDVRGEGLIGLTRGFMYAGSPRLIASLWPDLSRLQPCEPLSWTCAERCAGRLHITGQAGFSLRASGSDPYTLNASRRSRNSGWERGGAFTARMSNRY
jgi:CHAT domain